MYVIWWLELSVKAEQAIMTEAQTRLLIIIFFAELRFKFPFPFMFRVFRVDFKVSSKASIYLSYHEMEIMTENFDFL